MAGDWIKMRQDLPYHPKVVRMASLLDVNKFQVVGALHAVWSLFDKHSETGFLGAYDARILDEYLAWMGFSEAMILVGWLVSHEHGLEIPDFEENNGASAKRRCENVRRKRKSRARHSEVTDMSPHVVDINVTREEKRRVENKNTLRAAEPPDCPYSDIVDLYHQHCPVMPRVKTLTETRKKQLKARWREDRERQNLEWWARFFQYCSGIPFLCGESSTGFIADLEWLTKQSNFVKTIEGKYESGGARYGG